VTPASIIVQVRSLVQDTRTPYRYTDTVLLGFVNQALKRMAMVRPDLFTVFETVATAPNTVIQRLPSTATRLVEIYNVEGGSVITEVDKNALDQTYPGWRSAAPGQPVNYIRHVRNPNSYFLYPAPEPGIMVVAEFSVTPEDYGINEEIDILSSTYMPALVDGTVFLTQSIDDEHVTSGRAKLFQDSFNQTLVAGLQTRVITDTDAGGLDPKQVI